MKGRPLGQNSIKYGDNFENDYGPYTVICRDNKKVTVRFLNTGTIVDCHLQVVILNQVRDYMKPMVHGVGFMGEKTVSGNTDKNKKKAKMIWDGFITRCYDPEHYKKRPTYIGCYVSPEWHNFSNFHKWFCQQVDADLYKSGYELDKDLLIRGNREYGPDTCVFIPSELNSMLSIHKNYGTNSYLPGVFFDTSRNKYRAECNRMGLSPYIGRYDSELEAFLAYKSIKEDYVRSKAKEFVGILPNSVIEALSDYSLDYVLIEYEKMAK